MKPGKKPMSTALKLLTGNKRYVNEKEPKPKPIEGLSPPDWLPESVREKYKEFAIKLKKLGILKETDEITFALMFMHLAITIEAAENLSKENISVADNRGVERKNCNLQVLRDNSLAYLRYANLFGLDPSSRQDLKVEEDLSDDPMERLFERKRDFELEKLLD
jgi:P27 family predicted phage terminase small subunit